jgi:hypothetical protein
MPRWPREKDKIIMVQSGKSAVTLWTHLIEQTEKTPGPYQQFCLKYLHEKFCQQWPKQYAKTYGKSTQPTDTEADGKVVCKQL